MSDLNKDDMESLFGGKEESSAATPSKVSAPNEIAATNKVLEADEKKDVLFNAAIFLKDLTNWLPPWSPSKKSAENTNWVSKQLIGAALVELVGQMTTAL